MTPQTRNDDRQIIRRAIRDLLARFPPEYWRVKDERREYPTEFVDELMRAGWMGVNIPAEYGGGGYGITEASIVLEELSASNGGLSAAGAAHASLHIRYSWICNLGGQTVLV
jgi:acyl-CoA dehydrogenase